MDYSALQQGDLILTSEPSITSKIIQFFSGSPWSHSSIYTGYGNFVSASPFVGVCIKRVDQLPEKMAIYRYAGISAKQQQKIVSHALKQIGKPYDFLQVFVLIYRFLTNKLRTNIDDPAPDNYMCSELVAESYAAADIYLAEFIENVSPGSLIENKQMVLVHTTVEG